MTNFELATRVPLMVHVPWKPASFGQHTSTPVEIIDIYRVSLLTLPYCAHVAAASQHSSLLPVPI